MSFCKQLTGRISSYIRHCRQLVVLQVSGLDKLTDEDIAVLFSDTFNHLNELDISHTSITDRSLEAIAKGRNCLGSLTVLCVCSLCNTCVCVFQLE